MMQRRSTMLLLGAVLGVSACSSMSGALDAINPFSGSSVKMAPLQAINATTELRSLWTASAGKAADYTFTPATVGNAVYVAAVDGTVHKLEDGKTVWRINAGQRLSAGVGAGANLVAVGTPKGEVLAFSAATGAPLWQARVTSEVLASPTVGDEGVAVKSGDNRVFLLDLNDGARKWMYQRATPALSLRSSAAPVFADRYLFVGFPGGKLMALGLQNGAPVWEGAVALPKGATELDRVADVVTPPAIDGGQVCAVAFQGRVACFDLAQNGALVWARDLSSASGLVLDGRYLFVTDEKGAVHAFDRISGSGLWKQDKLLNRKVSGPSVRRGLVVVADGEGLCISSRVRMAALLRARKQTVHRYAANQKSSATAF
jgi:outer membrane protein assembly factor BamB